MSNMFSILQSNYLTVGSTTYSKAKYVNVKPGDYEGNWSGKFGDGKRFSVQISGVQGFKAKVKYQDDVGVNYSQVLIRDASFKIGNSKFQLIGGGKALVSTVVTDAYTGMATVKRAYATQG